jgi:hypothetical protein
MPFYDINLTDGEHSLMHRVECTDLTAATELARGRARAMMNELQGAHDWSKWRIEIAEVSAASAEATVSPTVIPLSDPDAELG